MTSDKGKLKGSSWQSSFWVKTHLIQIVVH